jgi:hypothetical protein
MGAKNQMPFYGGYHNTSHDEQTSARVGIEEHFPLQSTILLNILRVSGILKDSGEHIEVPVLSGAILPILLSCLALMSLLEAMRIICYEVEQEQTVKCIQQQIVDQIYKRFCFCIINGT